MKKETVGPLMGTREEGVDVHNIVEETLNAWAEADAKSDIGVAIKKLEFFIDFMSSYSILIKHASSDGEVQEIKEAMEQFKEAKDALRKMKSNLAVAC
ncbi:MAG: hypothetical protein NVS1B10_07790 [Candidatus Saccharimonadales bacterium]